MSVSRRLLGAGWAEASATVAMHGAHIEIIIRLLVFAHRPILKSSSGWLGE